MAFRIGQRVCCIQDNWVSAYTGAKDTQPGPVKGGIYTVSGLHSLLGSNYLELVEFPDRGGFETWAFRPVHDTDISIFTAMLAPEPNAPARKHQTVEG